VLSPIYAHAETCAQLREAFLRLKAAWLKAAHRVDGELLHDAIYGRGEQLQSYPFLCLDDILNKRSTLLLGFRQWPVVDVMQCPPVRGKADITWTSIRL
jgi:hypothetical protein